MKYKIFTLLLGILLMSSCDSILEEKVFDFIGPEEVGDSDEAADRWVLGVYNVLSNDCYGWSIHPKFLEYDCDYNSGPDWAFAAFGAGNFQGEQNMDAMWNHPYKMIHRANVGIRYISQMTAISEEHKKNCLGELYFLKAYSYFLLVRSFGEVPIFKKSVNEGEALEQPRRPVAEVYEYIISLLNDAKGLAYKNTDARYKAGRASAGAAAGLLAKVYATMASGALPATETIKVKGGKALAADNSLTLPIEYEYAKTVVKGYESFDSKSYYTLARDLAKDVIDNKYGTYSLYERFMDTWQIASRNKREFMFALQAKNEDQVFGNSLLLAYCGVEDANGRLTQGQWVGGRWHWYNLFESKDQRIVEGVHHRWYWATSNWGASYYPNNEEWTKKSQGYVDEETGEFIPPVAPFNDGNIYSTDATYLAYPTKYYYVSDRTAEKTDGLWPILRLADIYLLYAEASNELDGPNESALFYLNEIRKRSSATPRKIVGDGSLIEKVDFRSQVIEERARELAFEGDRRWDLIRWGIYLKVMNEIGGSDERGVVKTRDEKHLLFPIPSSEISTNPYINENNPGWK